MKHGPVIGIIVMILGLIVLSLAYAMITPPPPPPPYFGGPMARLSTVEDINETIINIEAVSFEVPLEDVDLILIYRGSNKVTKFNLSDFVYSQSESSPNNISYHDKNLDNDLSQGDFLILKTDWDGPNNDGDGDGNFTNDGPIMEGDRILLIYKKNGNGICVIDIRT